MAGAASSRSAPGARRRRSLSTRCRASRIVAARPSCTAAGVISPMPEWRCSPLYQEKNVWQKTRASSRLPKRAREVRAVLQRLELGLGERVIVAGIGPAVWFCVTPRSASSNATGLAVMEEPRSACRVNCPGPICCFSQVSVMSRWASPADSARGDHPADHVAAEDIQNAHRGRSTTTSRGPGAS